MNSSDIHFLLKKADELPDKIYVRSSTMIKLLRKLLALHRKVREQEQQIMAHELADLRRPKSRSIF